MNRLFGPPPLKSERWGTWWLGLAFMAWVSVELWRSSLPQEPEPIGIKEVLFALDRMPSGPQAKAAEQQNRLSSMTPVESGKSGILVDLLDSVGWVGLGLSPRQAQSALRYRKAVGGFRDLGALRRMRVLPDGWLDRHEAHLVFPPPLVRPIRVHRFEEDLTEKSFIPAREDNTMLDSPRGSVPVDLNLADSLTLLSMRGVGPWVAGRILKARRNWGGFSHVNQLKLALGWDSLAQSLAGQFTCAPAQVQKQCIGDLDAEGWSVLPGVGWKRGCIISRYVAHHGARLAALRGCMALDSSGWANILPHLEECIPNDAVH